MRAVNPTRHRRDLWKSNRCAEFATGTFGKGWAIPVNEPEYLGFSVMGQAASERQRSALTRFHGPRTGDGT